MQAVLIIAHKDVNSVIELALLLKERFLVYIHFDKKCRLNDSDKLLLEKNNIRFFQIVSVNWGSWSVCNAVLLLLKETVKNKDIEYFHIISGQDFIAQSIDNIYDFYEGNNNIYMNYFPAKGMYKSGEPIIMWQKFYFYYDLINRKTIFGKIFHRISIIVQLLLRIDKIKKYNINLQLFQGSNWMDLPRYAVEYLLDFYEKNENYLEFFSTGFCSDEFWIQTVLCNSEFRSKIVQDNHRYIDWHERNGSYPAILDSSDIDKIQKGNYHFIRKVDNKYSKELKDIILNNVNNG